MKSRQTTTYAAQTYITYKSDGTINSSAETRPEVYRDNLSVQNPGTLKGNFSSPNSLQFDRYLRCVGCTGYWFSTRGSGGGLISQTFGNTAQAVPTPQGVDMAMVYNRAVSDLNDKVRASIDWSVNAGQTAQVKSMVSNAFQALAHVKRSVNKLDLWGAYLAYRRYLRSPNKVSRPVKELGSKWLEFQYGWKPLAQDIYNTAVELGRDFPSLMIAEAKSSYTERWTRSVPWYEQPGTADYTATGRVQMKVRMTPSTSMVQLMSNFTSLNPASIAWELTPFSFVVDWFVDVGGYMRNLETSLLSKNNFKDGFVTYSQLQVVTYTVNGDNIHAGDGVYRTAHFGGTSRITLMNRVPLASYPLPMVPTFKADLGSGRLLNAAALMSQQLKLKR